MTLKLNSVFFQGKRLAGTIGVFQGFPCGGTIDTLLSSKAQTVQHNNSSSQFHCICTLPPTICR